MHSFSSATSEQHRPGQSALISPETLWERFAGIRARTEYLTAPLEIEDFVVQSMTDCSPTKWHLAHTTWFFETFILQDQPGYRHFDPNYNFLFNSYYNSVGERYARPDRGMVTRPTVSDVMRYRAHVNEAMQLFLEREPSAEYASRIELGLNHEQQHQELLLTDLKHLLSLNPLHPLYRDRAPQAEMPPSPFEWIPIEGGLQQIGYHGKAFAFDNETPRHKTYVEPFLIASRLVTNGEYLKFIEAGGYADPLLWLSDGHAAVVEKGWLSPLYWHNEPESGWHHFTLHGYEALDLNEPVTHISYYEAHAFAEWAGARLLTEAEWEVAADQASQSNLNSYEESYHPVIATGSGLQQMIGDTWQWTESAYLPYPSFKAANGALGEYNGKFMINQMVLRGGSVATPHSHIRPTYRNFFHPSARWQFSGIRLAKKLV